MKANNKIAVLIPDGESHILYYIINCFAKSGGVKLYVMSDKEDNYMKSSRYIEKFLYHKEKKDDGWLGVIDENVNKYNIDVILPIFEKGIRVIIENKGKLKNRDKLCPLPSLKDFDTACDKELLHDHLKTSGLSYPLGAVAKPGQFPDLSNLKYPIIAKPVNGSGGGVGVKVLRNSDEVLQYCKNCTFKCNIIFQEYINGFDVCSNVLCENGEILAHTIQKGVEFEKGEETFQIAFDFIENKTLYEQTLSLMKGLSWTGVANIDWRYDVDLDEFKVIEINPRYWYNTDASALVGVNFPYLSCLNFLGRKIENRDIDYLRFYNLKGLVKKLKRNPLFAIKIGFLKRQTPVFFALQDPMPMIHKFLWRTKNKIFGN